ncbi:hypothetical protein [Kitasatospora sp. HPMI-4]|uniref:hypothetical protein n=1 Tax=Kitasatospora sp. HPMI-4 TaxID=3448443 RepID=UPI003F1D717B
MRIRKLLAAATVAGTVATTALATAGSASAFTRDCWDGQVCLYYNSSSYGYGAVFVQTESIGNYGSPDVKFSGGNNGSSGAGVSVKNHAAAVDNRWGGSFIVYYNSGNDCSVACQTIPMHSLVDLNGDLKNNNAAGEFIGV